MKSLRVLVLVLILSYPFLLESVVQKKTFLHIKVSDGLPMSGVTAIQQGANGIIWMGLDSIPLVKYDGRAFKKFQGERDLREFLKGKGANCITEDSKGNLWIGTQIGAVVFNPVIERFKRIGKDLIETDEPVTSIIVDRSSRIWIGSSNGVVVLRHQYAEKENFRDYIRLNQFLKNQHITAITEDAKGNIWIGTRRGVFQYRYGDPAPVKTDFFPSDAAGNVVKAIVVTEDNFLWIGTENRGLFACNLNSGEVKNFCKSSSAPDERIACNNITTMLETRSGELWVGTVNGLWIKGRDGFTGYSHAVDDSHSISADHVRGLIEDDSGMVWIATKSGGISKVLFNSGMFGHIKHKKNNSNSLSGDSIFAVFEDHLGMIWIGSHHGVDVMNPETGKFRHYRHNPSDGNSLLHNHVYDINAIDELYIWIGTREGLVRFNRKKREFDNFIFDKVNINNPANKINRIGKGMDDNIWLSTYNGMLEFRPSKGSFKHYYHDPSDKNSICSDYVWDIMEYEKGKLWICTRRGLNHYDIGKDEFRHYSYDTGNPGGISGDNVYTVFRDKEGVFWFGTTNGLNRYDRGSDTFTTFTTIDGLPDNVIYGIEQDNMGNMWVSTNNGLSRFNPVQMDFVNFDVTDGLQSMEFNFPSVKTKNGDLIFAGINGINFFKPEAIRRDHTIPSIVFTGLKIFNSQVEVGEIIDGEVVLQESINSVKSITLSHKSYVFDVEFAALHYADPDNNKYLYKLEGFDPEWNYVGSRNFATYTNLSPGEYVLKVKASNSDAVWNEKGSSLRLIIRPPFWKTLWFWGLVLIFISGAAVSLYRFRINMIKKQNILLEQLVEERSAQLEKSHRIIVEQAHKSGMAEVASNTLHNVGNILNSVFISIDNLKKLSRYSGVDTLNKASSMLDGEMENLENFVKNDPKAVKLMLLFVKVDRIITKQKEEGDRLLKRLFEKVQEISRVITVQQAYSGKPENMIDEVEPEKIVSDALVVCSDMLALHNVKVEKWYERHQRIYANKPMLMQILMDIITNSIEALKDNHEDNRKITFITESRTEMTLIKIVDNGCGIPQDALDRIFSQGYTTKSGKLGYRLHHCANSMVEMGGNICADSKGEGKGTTMVLAFKSIKE